MLKGGPKGGQPPFWAPRADIRRSRDRILILGTRILYVCRSTCNDFDARRLKGGLGGGGGSNPPFRFHALI